MTLLIKDQATGHGASDTVDTDVNRGAQQLTQFSLAVRMTFKEGDRVEGCITVGRQEDFPAAAGKEDGNEYGKWGGKA